MRAERSAQAADRRGGPVRSAQRRRHELIRHEHRRHEGGRHERGGGTVATAGAVAMLLVVTLAAAQLGAVVIATHRARAAADLAALSAAGVAVAGTGEPCVVAAEVARANGAMLRACESAADLSVRVSAQAPLVVRLPGLPEAASARARAGPAPPSSGAGPG